MNYVLKGHDCTDDIVSVLMMFYPNEKYIRVFDTSNGITLYAERDGEKARAALYENGELLSEGFAEGRTDTDREHKRIICLAVFNAINAHKGYSMPWGILTGVRPAKLISEMRASGMTEDEIRHELKEYYLVSDQKLALMCEVSLNEEKIVKSGSGKIGIYIGIPFCPSRCLYCSFTSYPLDKYSKKVDSYLDQLEKEMEFTSHFTKTREIDSIYIGGGTPTSLNETQLERLLDMTGKYFGTAEEYTVEAGRPDTVTREKLRLIKQAGATRISVNPQTLNDKTLELIGRRHTVKDFITAFTLAREEGHTHINTDMILGLPGEGEKEVTHTLQGLYDLSPESITVHTLAVKRASRLKEMLEDYSLAEFELMNRVIELSDKYARQMGMFPYYMYRQKNMLGNFENVGYCKPGHECRYNVQIMEEKQSIIAVGAGASTKLVNRQTDQIERIFNVKSVDDYITRIDEMLKRKEEIKWL